MPAGRNLRLGASVGYRQVQDFRIVCRHLPIFIMEHLPVLQGSIFAIHDLLLQRPNLIIQLLYLLTELINFLGVGELLLQMGIFSCQEFVLFHVS